MYCIRGDNPPMYCIRGDNPWMYCIRGDNPRMCCIQVDNPRMCCIRVDNPRMCCICQNIVDISSSEPFESKFVRDITNDAENRGNHWSIFISIQPVG